MRCITAIWPAGPPKLRSATRTQTRKASAKLTACVRSTSSVIWTARTAGLSATVEATELGVRRHRLGARDVAGGRAWLRRHGEHAMRRHIDELRAGFDKTPDQPSAGDAVDLGVFACDPFHSLLLGGLRRKQP